MDDDKQCFICLSSELNDPELGALGRHCQCPTLFSHKSCLTRWQLQQAGKAEERTCRFCKTQLGDWREEINALTNSMGQEATASSRYKPIMAVVFQGKTVKVPVSAGPDGVAEFKKTVCKLFNLPEGTDFEVTFECKSPVFGDKLHLKGFGCFEAASYCAAVSAAKRASSKAAAAAAHSASHAAGVCSSQPTTPRGSSHPASSSLQGTGHEAAEGIDVPAGSRISRSAGGAPPSSRLGDSRRSSAASYGAEQSSSPPSVSIMQRIFSSRKSQQRQQAQSQGEQQGLDRPLQSIASVGAVVETAGASRAAAAQASGKQSKTLTSTLTDLMRRVF